ncbi:MAG: elongation factor G [Candidatus Omnitrophica bacterium]|nr:elongation factor G [Candidatus Omnitrophota bacterium]
MDVNKKRSVILLGHAHSGKTSLAEAMLFNCKALTRRGSVMEGNTVSDYSADEAERKISINASMLYCESEAARIQIIDAPGYLDFYAEVLAGIRAVDSAVVVIDATDGIAAGTERVWQDLEEIKMPRLIFINKTDREGVNVDKVIEEIRSGLSKKAVVVGSFSDAALIEAVAETDDQLLERYLEGAVLSEDEIKTALHEAVDKGEIFPILSGSALNNQGVSELAAAIIHYLPNPSERTAVFAACPKEPDKKTEITFSDGSPLSGFVFKSISDPYVGQLTVIRIFSGKLLPNTSFYNSTKKTQERIGPIYILQGKEQRGISEAGCGDIVAIAKLKDTFTNDSISSQDRPLVFEPIVFPEPLISASVRPKTRQDEEKISPALAKLMIEDQTFKVSRDNQTREEIVSGLGDLHLDVLMGRLKKRFNVEVTLGTPQVPYKETITKAVKMQGKYKKQSGGRGQYGDVWIEIRPLERGKDFEFVNRIVGGAIPRNYVPSVEKGVRNAMQEGIVAGYPVVDVQVVLCDGSYHEVDSSDMAFQIAGSMAIRKAVQEAAPALLEPIMDVEVVIPEEYMGQISGDVNSRRGRVMGMEIKGKNNALKAQVPLAEMFKYANDLRSMTGGRGYYTMNFSHYEQVPHKHVSTVIAQSQAHQKAGVEG